MTQVFDTMSPYLDEDMDDIDDTFRGAITSIRGPVNEMLHFLDRPDGGVGFLLLYRLRVSAAELPGSPFKISAENEDLSDIFANGGAHDVLTGRNMLLEAGLIELVIEDHYQLTTDYIVQRVGAQGECDYFVRPTGQSMRIRLSHFDLDSLGQDIAELHAVQDEWNLEPGWNLPPQRTIH